MKRICTNRFPWDVLWTGEVGTFNGLINFCHQCWSMNAIILSADQWFDACTVVRSGNFKIFWEGQIVIWFKPEFSFYWADNYEISNILFSSLEPIVGYLLSIFPKLSSVITFLWTMTEI